MQMKVYPGLVPIKKAAQAVRSAMKPKRISVSDEEGRTDTRRQDNDAMAKLKKLVNSNFANGTKIRINYKSH